MVAVTIAARPALCVDKSAKEEAAAISQVATAKHQAGDFGLCAELFHQAYDKDPTYLPYLFSAARCLHKKGDLDAAERDYRQFLARSPKGAQLVDKAQEYLDQLLAARKQLKAAPAVDPKPVDPKPADSKPADPAPAATPTVVAVAPPPAPAERPMTGLQRIGWVAVGLGVVGVGTGAWALASASADRAALHQELAPTDSKLVVGLTRAEAQTRADLIGGRTTMGAVATGAGVVLAAAGAWLALRGPAEVAVAADGVQLTLCW